MHIWFLSQVKYQITRVEILDEVFEVGRTRMRRVRDLKVAWVPNIVLSLPAGEYDVDDVRFLLNVFF